MEEDDLKISSERDAHGGSAVIDAAVLLSRYAAARRGRISEDTANKPVEPPPKGQDATKRDGGKAKTPAKAAANGTAPLAKPAAAKSAPAKPPPEPPTAETKPRGPGAPGSSYLLDIEA